MRKFGMRWKAVVRRARQQRAEHERLAAEAALASEELRLANELLQPSDSRTTISSPSYSNVGLHSPSFQGNALASPSQGSVGGQHMHELREDSPGRAEPVATPLIIPPRFRRKALAIERAPSFNSLTVADKAKCVNAEIRNRKLAEGLRAPAHERIFHSLVCHELEEVTMIDNPNTTRGALWADALQGPVVKLPMLASVGKGGSTTRLFGESKKPILGEAVARRGFR
eukprot:Opistho-1_new@62678